MMWEFETGSGVRVADKVDVVSHGRPAGSADAGDSAIQSMVERAYIV